MIINHHHQPSHFSCKTIACPSRRATEVAGAGDAWPRAQGAVRFDRREFSLAKTPMIMDYHGLSSFTDCRGILIITEYDPPK